MEDLTKKHCEPCEGGTPPMEKEEIKKYLMQLANWKVMDDHHLIKTYKFKDFKDALCFVNQAGTIAEEEGHHPDMLLSWGKVEVKLFTHAMDGLSLNDFILAAKYDKIKVD